MLVLEIGLVKVVATYPNDRRQVIEAIPVFRGIRADTEVPDPNMAGVVASPLKNTR